MVEAEAAKSPIPPSGELSQRLASLLRWQSSPGAMGQSGPPPPPKHQAPAVGPPAANPVSPPTPLPSRQQPVPGPGEAKAEPTPNDLSSVKKLPKSKSSSRKAAGTAGSEPGAKAPTPRRKTQKRGLSSAQPPISGSGKAGEGPEVPDLTVYQIRLAPGPEVLRRGINPVGLLDELRDLGEATITTNADLVPPLDVIDPECCYLTWTITLKTGAEPDRIEDAFLFFAEDSIVTIQRWTSDGKLVPVRPAESKPAATAIVNGVGVSAAPTAEPSISTVSQPVIAATTGSPSPTHGNGAAAAHPATPIPVPAQSLPNGPSSAKHLIVRPHTRIRVDAAQLDDLVGLAGELVVVSDNLMGLRELAGVESWVHALESLQRVSRQIRDTTLELRMVPVDELFSRFPRVVRDLADRSGKEIELRIIGQETKLDRTIVERLSDPMIHLIRNAADHALETPQERLEKGKAASWSNHTFGRPRRGPSRDSGGGRWPRIGP